MPKEGTLQNMIRSEHAVKNRLVPRGIGNTSRLVHNLGHLVTNGEIITVFPSAWMDNPLWWMLTSPKMGMWNLSYSVNHCNNIILRTINSVDEEGHDMNENHSNAHRRIVLGFSIATVDYPWFKTQSEWGWIARDPEILNWDGLVESSSEYK